MCGVKLFSTDSKLEKAEFQLEKWKKLTKKNNGKGKRERERRGKERGKKGEGKKGNKLIIKNINKFQ